MREHQIVISLKPEQFQEVQKQARAAGAQSVGAFVRQNLLIFLGLEEAGNARKGNQNAAAVQADPDWTFIAGELRRLHRELKVLSSEATISAPLVTEMGGSLQSGPLLAGSLGLAEAYEEPAREENFLTDGAPISADDLPLDYEESLILPPAPGVQAGATTPFFQTPTMPNRTPFGLPMPAGQIPLSSPYSHHSFMPNITPLPADLGISPGLSQEAKTKPEDIEKTGEIEFEADTTAALEEIASEPVPEKPDESAIQQPVEPLPEPVSIAQTAAVPAPLQAVTPESPPQNQEPEPQTSAAPENPRTPAPPHAAEQSGAFAPQKDDMEVLADRAFAISPRLGAIDPEVTLQPAPTRSFADTLEELLDAGLINQVMSQTEEQTFSQPDQFAGEVGAPPEDYDAGEGVEVYVQEVEVPSVTDKESDSQSDKVEDETPNVIDHVPPPPPKPIGGDDETNEDDPPKPPPRRKKLM